MGFSFSSLARRLLWYSWNIPTTTWASAEIRVQVEDRLSSSDFCFFPSHLCSCGSCPHLGLTPSSRMEWKGHFMATPPGLWSWTSDFPWVCFTACTRLGGSWRSMWQPEPSWTSPQGLGTITDAEQRCSKQLPDYAPSKHNMMQDKHTEPSKIFHSSFCLDFSLFNITMSFGRGSFTLSFSTTENRLKAHKQTLTALRNHARSQQSASGYCLAASGTLPTPLEIFQIKDGKGSLQQKQQRLACTNSESQKQSKNKNYTMTLP